MRVSERGELIRKFLLENVGQHPTDISKFTAAHFGLTRQAVLRHLRRLIYEQSITEGGKTRNRVYKLAPLVERRKTYDISPELEEHLLWERDVAPALGQLPENVLDIWRYGFTEMANNAKDHSGGTKLIVGLSKTAASAHMVIADDGIGIFKKIQQALSLPDERYAVLELAKGKFTSDPKNHTGEGVFFSSRMFDKFSIGSGQTWLGRKFGDDSDWILTTDFPGTSVFMDLSNHTHRTEREIFDKYAGEDYGFNKTVVPVELAQYGDDKLVSRSQAKRVVARLDLFKTIVFDFSGVAVIGQAFADEIFRVFANEHPQIALRAVHTSSEVKRMIQRAQSATSGSSA